MEKRKAAVFITLILAIASIIALGLYEGIRLPKAFEIPTEGFPSIGPERAKFTFVVFEDFRCCNCRHFSETVFPDIKKHYVDTGKARYVMIPLAFLRGSKEIANAALSVYETNPDRFFLYASRLFPFCQSGALDEEKLLSIAEEVGKIDILSLQEAIKTRAYYPRLEENFDLASKVMDGNVRAPMLYINGVYAPTSSFEAVQARFKRISLHSRDEAYE